MMPAAPLSILHQDDDVFVLDKPAGLPVVPGGGEHPAACVRHLLERQVGEPVWVVHRLDRDTSGVLAFARHPDAHRRLNAAFEARAVAKTYLAVTAGVPVPPAGTIAVPLHEARRGRMRPCAAGETGVEAVTDYAVECVWGPAEAAVALVRACPRTGRHHQIRVHLRSMGTPILFDDVYGRSTLKGDWRAGPCQRLALHAVRLELPPSGHGPVLRIDAPVAADLAALIGWLDARRPVVQARAAGAGGLTSWLR